MATVLDLFSRKLLVSPTSEHPDAELAGDAIKMAAAVRGERTVIDGVIFHADGETVAAGFPRVPDPHSDGHDRCWYRALPGLPDPHADRRSVVFPRICRFPGNVRRSVG